MYMLVGLEYQVQPIQMDTGIAVQKERSLPDLKANITSSDADDINPGAQKRPRVDSAAALIAAMAAGAAAASSNGMGAQPLRLVAGQQVGAHHSSAGVVGLMNTSSNGAQYITDSGIAATSQLPSVRSSITSAAPSTQAHHSLQNNRSAAAPAAAASTVSHTNSPSIPVTLRQQLASQMTASSASPSVPTAAASTTARSITTVSPGHIRSITTSSPLGGSAATLASQVSNVAAALVARQQLTAQLNTVTSQGVHPPASSMYVPKPVVTGSTNSIVVIPDPVSNSKTASTQDAPTSSLPRLHPAQAPREAGGVMSGPPSHGSTTTTSIKTSPPHNPVARMQHLNAHAGMEPSLNPAQPLFLRGPVSSPLDAHTVKLSPLVEAGISGPAVITSMMGGDAAGHSISSPGRSQQVPAASHSGRQGSQAQPQASNPQQHQYAKDTQPQQHQQQLLHNALHHQQQQGSHAAYMSNFSPQQLSHAAAGQMQGHLAAAAAGGNNLTLLQALKNNPALAAAAMGNPLILGNGPFNAGAAALSALGGSGQFLGAGVGGGTSHIAHMLAANGRGHPDMYTQLLQHQLGMAAVLASGGHHHAGFAAERYAHFPEDGGMGGRVDHAGVVGVSGRDLMHLQAQQHNRDRDSRGVNGRHDAHARGDWDHGHGDNHGQARARHQPDFTGNQYLGKSGTQGGGGMLPSSGFKKGFPGKDYHSVDRGSPRTRGHNRGPGRGVGRGRRRGRGAGRRSSRHEEEEEDEEEDADEDEDGGASRTRQGGPRRRIGGPPSLRAAAAAAASQDGLFMMMNESEVEWEVEPLPTHADPLLVFHQSLLTKARSERELRMTSTPRLRRILKELGISGLKELRESDDEEDDDEEEDEEENGTVEEPAKGKGKRHATPPPPIQKRHKKQTTLKEENEDSSYHSHRGPALKVQAQVKVEAPIIAVQPSSVKLTTAQGIVKVEASAPAPVMAKSRRKTAPTRAAE
ncbi:hypothetical protein CEUSTIGMA_g7707.t1 [Chlamydomonas eustigma]|uniref:Uncharacterized protein n=1 Tax=Chlamydomonas eustigma TaxID=1157962 RepID=A0A250XBJ8_9CHLO|nr:hypothetical protein CEUSTIGMA_g7707.t1 [Chlamydomonas eustigma]|eukprot:GAX80269.1 hypothetical protein CEUSTIGMA_g7707.t1 [Chlamydomonas eustigma]